MQELNDMAGTYKRMEKVLLQHLCDLERTCMVASSTNKDDKAGTPDVSMREKENSANLTPDFASVDVDDVRMQSSPFGVKNLLMASGGSRVQNSQKLHCV